MGFTSVADVCLDGFGGEGDCDPVDESDGHVGSKASAGGGIFRAYVPEQSFGKRGRPGFKQIAGDYNRDKYAIRERLNTVGRDGTEAHAHGQGRSFGPCSRDVRRAVEKHEARASLEQIRTASAIVPANRSSIGDDALKHAFSVVAATSDVADGVRAGNAFIRHQNIFLREHCREDVMAILRWSESDGRQVIAHDTHDSPAVVHIQKHLVATHFGGVDVIEVVPQLNKFATAVSAVSQTAHHTNVAAYFGNRVERLSRCIMHYAIPPIDVGRARPRAKASFRLCQQASMCLCAEDTQDTWKLRNSLLRCFKLSCQGDSNARLLLLQRKVVAGLVGKKDAITDVWAQRRSLGECLSVDAIRIEMWYAVATIVFSPYIPILYEVIVRTPQPAEAPHGTIALEAARRRWVDHYVVAHGLRKDLEWRVQFFCRVFESQ